MAFMTKEWKGKETFSVDSFHHVELYVGNARQAAHFYCSTFGFKPFAYSGPETGLKTQCSYVLKLNDIRVVLTTPLTHDHPASEWLKRHGDSVHDIALRVADPKEAFSEAIKRGGKEAYAPRVLKDADGVLRVAGLRTYGEVIHTLIDPSEYKG